MNALIVSATKKNDPKDTLLYKSLTALKDKGVKFQAQFFTNNNRGLSVVYNEAFESNFHTYDIIAFVHDDVYLDDAFVFDKIADSFDLFDIVGVAGGSNPTIKAPTLWHLMTERYTWRGAVGHFISNEEMAVTSFGPVPGKVDILDGVFLAINVNKCRQQRWRFNENYDFHLYDVASTLDATRTGLRCGVLPIHIVHMSPGLRDPNDAKFVENQSKFLKQYASKL